MPEQPINCQVERITPADRARIEAHRWEMRAIGAMLECDPQAAEFWGHAEKCVLLARIHARQK